MLNRPRPLTHIAGLMLNAAVLLTPPHATAAGSDRKIEISSEKTANDESTVTVVISGIPPEELGSEGMKALLGYLTGRRNFDGLLPGARDGAKPLESAASAPIAPDSDRDEREFDLELHIHWKRATNDPKRDSKHEAKKPGEPKGAAEPKTREAVKEGGGTLDSLKKMISGEPAKSAPATSDKPVDATKGESRRNDAEVDALLHSLGNLQKRLAEQAKGAERVKGLAERAEKTRGAPEAEREIRKVAEAAAELDKMARDLEKRSKQVEEALERARARLSDAGPGASSGAKAKKP